MVRHPTLPGKGSPNPIACILSFAMCLHFIRPRGRRESCWTGESSMSRRKGFRTADIMQDGMTKVATAAMTSAIVGTR